MLKPGGTLVFIQRLTGGPAQAMLASGAGAVGEHTHIYGGSRRSKLPKACWGTSQKKNKIKKTSPASAHASADPTCIDAVQMFDNWDFVQVWTRDYSLGLMFC